MGFVLILVLAFLVFIFAKAILKAKFRQHYADEQSARRAMATHHNSGGVALRPSWFTNEGKMETFELSTTKLSQTRGIPVTWVMRVFMEGILRDTMFSFVAHMEREGSSFTEQELGAYKFISETWAELSTDKKNQLIALADSQAAE